MAQAQYGIGVTRNRFALFDNEEEDPLEVLKVIELEKEARKKTKLSEKENKGRELSGGGGGKVGGGMKERGSVQRKGVIKETQNIKLQVGQRGFGKEESGKGGGKFGVGSKGERQQEKKSNPSTGEHQQEDYGNLNKGSRGSEEKSLTYRGEREGGMGGGYYGGGSDLVSGGEARWGGRGGSRGGGRGGQGGGRGGRGGGRSFDSRGKREYERQSGSDKTGVKAIDKRDGSGAHNWGSHKDDLEDIQNISSQSGDEVQLEKGTEDLGLDEEVGGSALETTEGVGEDEPKELTLDEWKALKGPRTQPVYNLRKAGEGEDLSQWKKGYVLHKKKGEDEEEEEEYESCDYPQRVGRQKHILDIDIHFKDTRGRGGRGGRGGARGGRPGSRSNESTDLRQGSQSEFNNKFDISKRKVQEQQKKSAPKVDDERDFPSLG